MPYQSIGHGDIQSLLFPTSDTKDGPNKGKSFQAPTIPLTCKKTAPRAVQWLVTVFHPFKAHLNPVAIDNKTKRGQLKASSPLRNWPPPPPPQPPWLPPSTTAPGTIAKLQAEIQPL
ncbi:hypothetical protein EDC04DRAFT_2606526 [Pisolithus marmoratus]|nr:hypothetical protein EDC04DRAFT_2606526 [Pisolithus marmoratus]